MKFDLPDYYINRELSWLSFNERVLEEADDSANPLFERLKFLAITSSNLDEFFMVRVAGLKDQVKVGFTKPDNKSGMTPKEQLMAISERSHEMIRRMFQILKESITPDLEKEGIRFLKGSDLNEKQLRFLNDYYHHHVYPVLTPMAVDASHPFPMLLNKTLNLAVLLESELDGEEEPLFAVVQVPSIFPRFVQLPAGEGEAHFILLEEVIRMHINSLFQGFKIVEVSPFRIIRNADLTIHEEETEDLLEAIEQELKRRKMGAAVRLGMDISMSKYLKDTLKDWLELEEWDVYAVEGPLDLSFFFSFYSLAGYEHLKFVPNKPQMPKELADEDQLFEVIAQKDILLHHPYDSFDPVVHFVEKAADDPQVLAIKQTLYRVSGDSPIVNALVRAAENGKQVTVLLELKARFDEENNIVWAKKLEKAGCHVIYGLVGLKTHSKITLVVRAEQNGIRRYLHLSTGNYNDTTARFYTDLGMFTAREEFGVDASAFFNYLSGYSSTPDWNVFGTAPDGMREKFLRLIDTEIQHKEAGKPARITAKMNSLTDKDLIEALYRASCAGVEIDLIIRGICCLRPGIPGVSENIRVISIVGRYLEHSRIYYFENGGEAQIFLSSADWMTRNMMARVELMFPVVQEDLKDRIKHILDVMLRDNVKARMLRPDGVYERVRTGEEALESQMFFYEEACRQAETDSSLLTRRLQPIVNAPEK
ncbi:RNA degradosome polyphosphate kinase [Effusibacillus lacus]|uniref:Polyphosphate kinase n=1 Tax=Effusibacillus lacus TaxID=1348429 RepID=A0A292YLI4_9BACL|nr:RNA degradosome polyphosphate kinase [Effusibacillus lacus]GAX89244.1 RNA degradosome polyphosphate kinase [Effusibacillus lacus]